MLNKTYYLNGVQNPKFEPLNISEVSILATFDNANVQPSLTVSEITFRQDAAEVINDYVDAGQSGGIGVFEGMDFKIVLNDGSQSYNAFDGFIDFVNAYTRNPDNVSVSIRDKNGINHLEDRAKAFSFAYLESIGLITSADYLNVPYVINYIPDGTQIIFATIGLYMMGKEIVDISARLAQAVNDAASITVGGGLTGFLGAILMAALYILLEVAYAIAMLIYIEQLLETIISNIFSDVRYYKAMRVKRLLEVGAQYMGLGFSSTLFDGAYANLTFLPFKSKKGNFFQTDSNWDGYGYPGARGYGYSYFEIMNMVAIAFNARPVIIDGVLHIEGLKNKDFWQKQSSYVLPLVLDSKREAPIKYNTNELFANYLIAFELDNNDRNTLDNFTGTNYERLTAPKVVSNIKNVLVRNLQEIRIPAALGTRKNELTAVEIIIKELAELADFVMGIFGASQKWAGLIVNRIGMLTISADVISVPKLLICDSNGKLPTNHRDLLSAKALYNGFHYTTSFVSNNFTENQYEVYVGVEIPFGFRDFLKTIQNGWFVTTDGRKGKFDKIDWKFSEEVATVDYRIEKVYTTNLTETFVEP